MSRILAVIFAVVWAGLVAAVSAEAQVPPPPVFDNLGVQATCVYDTQTQSYKYQYLVTNPPTNTLQLWSLDVSLGWGGSVFGAIQKPEGWDGEMSDPTWVDNPARFPRKPSVGWNTVGINHTMVNPPDPGTISGPFAFSVFAPPAIRQLWASPWMDPYWDAYMQATGQDEVDLSVSVPLELSLIRKIPTLGPLGVTPNTYEHWDTFLANVAQAGTLGWISDATLLSGIQANLQAARQAALAQDQATVNAKLQAVIGAIQAATPSQRTPEGHALVLYNAQYLQQNLPWPCEPKLTLAPATATHAIGETHAATAMLVNVANGQPIANNFIEIRVTEGPHVGQMAKGTTAADGSFSFAYTGTQVGVDTLVADTGAGTIRTAPGKNDAAKPRPAGRKGKWASVANCTAWQGMASAPSTVTWTGGPDLTVIGFIPPVLISAPGRTFYISETTMNTGILPAGPSVTRYYLSSTSPVDSSTAIAVGERNVPALAPGEMNKVETVPYTVPASLSSGTYYLDACADANHQIAETNEDNNCASSRLQIAPAAVPPIDCSKALANPSILWPPNHKLVPISITGVIAPAGDTVTVSITGITQDEPGKGVGDGDTCPDGFGVGTSQAQVRAERSGTGNGRVYVISFTATDAHGAACNGVVKVGVPHDKNVNPRRTPSGEVRRLEDSLGRVGMAGAADGRLPGSRGPWDPGS
ncbi:MAG: CARDB domain-containing protein, partial [Acidobacteriota bacterium]